MEIARSGFKNGRTSRTRMKTQVTAVIFIDFIVKETKEKFKERKREYLGIIA